MAEGGVRASGPNGRRVRNRGWSLPPESILKVEADSDDEGDVLAPVAPDASQPQSQPEEAAPTPPVSRGKKRKRAADQVAPRVDRFVLAPLVKIMRDALARGDHPRAAAAAALVLTAARGREGEPIEDGPNKRDNGNWSRGSHERAEYGEAEHAAIHAAMDIMRAHSSTSLTPDEEIRLLELARRCTKRGTDANEDDLVRIATVYYERFNDPDRAAAELLRDERAVVPPKGSKGAARRVPHSYRRLRLVALIKHGVWLKQSQFVNVGTPTQPRVPLNSTGTTAPGPGGRQWNQFELRRIEALAKDAEDALLRAQEKAEETGEKGDPVLAEARAQIRMAAGDVVGAREVLEDLADREDAGNVTAQEMLVNLLEEIKTAANPRRLVRSAPSSPGNKSEVSGDSDGDSDSDSDSDSSSDSSSDEDDDNDAHKALLERLGDVPDAHTMARCHLVVLKIDPANRDSVLGLTRAFVEAEADEARALLERDHIASQDAWRMASREKHATARAVLEALCAWAESTPDDAAPWRALTVAVTGHRWKALDAHFKYGAKSLADPVTTELRARGEVVGGADDIVHVFRGGGDPSPTAGRLATWATEFTAIDKRSLTSPEGIAALASRTAALAALFHEGDVAVVDAFVKDATKAVNVALRAVHGRKRIQRHPELSKGATKFAARYPSSRAVVKEALVAAKAEAAAEFAIRNEEVARDATAALGGDDARMAIVPAQSENAAETLYALPPVDPTTEEGAEILARRRERAPTWAEFHAIAEWVHAQRLAVVNRTPNEAGTRANRVATGGSRRTNRVRLQELIDVRDGRVLKRGMKRRKGDPRAVRVLTEPEREEITRLTRAIEAEERDRETKLARKAAGPKPECLSEKPVSRREVESAVRAEAAGTRAFSTAAKLLTRRNGLLETQLAALKDWKRRGGDLNGHDERTLARLERWRNNLTLVRNKLTRTRRRREVAAGMADAVRHHADVKGWIHSEEPCARCRSAGKASKYCGSDFADPGCDEAPEVQTFLPHRYGKITSHLVLDWEPSWMQSKRRRDQENANGGDETNDIKLVTGKRLARCAGCRHGQGSAATCGTRLARSCCVRSLDITVLLMPAQGPHERTRRRCDACKAGGVTPRLCGTTLAEPGCLRRFEAQMAEGSTSRCASCEGDGGEDAWKCGTRDAPAACMFTHPPSLVQRRRKTSAA